jgi:hypothetical protein
MTRKTTGTGAASYYTNKNLGLSTLETAQVNSNLTKVIYHVGNYTGDNVASQAQVEPPTTRTIDWDELGIDLDDLEMIAEIVR